MPMHKFFETAVHSTFNMIRSSWHMRIAKEVRLGINLLPLLQKEVRIGNIALKKPGISIVRNLDGKFNFEKPEATGSTSSFLDRTFTDHPLPVCAGALPGSSQQVVKVQQDGAYRNQ